MSWEWTVLLSVIIICGYDFALKKIVALDRVTDLKNAVIVLTARIECLEQKGEEITRIADETKKMLSQTNLAQSIRGR